MSENSERQDSARHAFPTLTEVRTWLVSEIASERELSPDQIQVDRSILSYGVDSMQVVTIIARLEDWLGIRFSSNPIDDHPTIESLSRFALSQLAESASAEK